MRHFYLCALLICTISGLAQSQFTPYDDLPGIHKSLKPTLMDDAPEWAKLMYTYPVNFNQIKKEYKAYQASGPKKNAYTRYYKIWSRAISQLVDDEGIIHMPSERHIDQVLTSNRERQSSIQTRNSSNWSFLGPKVTHWLKENNSTAIPESCPWQVNIYCMDIFNSNVNIMYCGTETGAINKSTDKGLTWQMMTRDYSTGGAVSSIAIHPTNANIVYACAGNQVHKTLDGGLTWKPLLTNVKFNANTIKIESLGSKLIASSESGIYISKDEGATWQKKLTLKAYDIEFSQDNESIIYALGSVNQKFTVYMSTDGGETFAAISNFPQTYVDASGGVLAVSTSATNVLMMTLLSESNTPIIVRGDLSNNGWTWKEIVRGNSSKLPMDNGQGYYDLDMEISYFNSNKFVVATTTLYKTSNGGSSFTAIGGYAGSYPIHPDIQDLEFGLNDDIWVATDGGLSLSTDYFTNPINFHSRTDGIVGSDFWGFDQGWNEDIIVAGRYHNGNTAIADFYQPKAIRMGGAESPTGWVLQGKSRSVAFDDLGGGWVLPAKAEDRYEDRFLFTKYPNMDEYGGRRGNLLHHPYYHSHLYLGEGNALWSSKDAGLTWDMQYQFTNRVMTIQIGIEEANVMYADIVGLGLHRSEDGGKTWVRKPTLTSAPNGTSYWNGKLSLALSPYDADIIYACLQNGTWSADKGKIFKSTDGGSTWTNITYGLDEYMKSIVVQPSTDNKDLVYLFSNARNNLQANVWMLRENSTSWESYNTNFPMGMNINHVLPFYRDGKIRVGGNLGVWESNLENTSFTPIIRPWLDKATVECLTDTISFDDHSIMGHAGATWAWTITPSPSYISSTSIRNPKVVLGSEGKFTVNLKVTAGGKSYEKTMENIIEAKKCPSLETCDNPTFLTKEMWKVTDFDSEEVNNPGRAAMAIDGDENTIWHTRWSTGNDPYPHYIDFDLGREYYLHEFTYLPRQDGGHNGRVKDFELYFTNTPDDWAAAIAEGSFENTSAPKTVKIDSIRKARYIRFRALSEANGNPWTSVAEFDFKGCYAELSNTSVYSSENTVISPIPASDKVKISLPYGEYSYQVFSNSGSLSAKGKSLVSEDGLVLDIQSLPHGIYYVLATNAKGSIFKMRFVKT